LGSNTSLIRPLAPLPVAPAMKWSIRRIANVLSRETNCAKSLQLSGTLGKARALRHWRGSISGLW
jgi:hypothetical protein